MELRLLSENKLKITLTNEDMELLDITYEEIDYPGDVGTRRVLWEILEQAKRQIGFDAGREKLYVQVHPEKSGGCLMYVTKENAAEAAPAESAAKPNKKSDGATYEKRYGGKLYTSVKKKRLLYMFDGSESLIGACSRLSLAGYGGKSEIFADAGRYYLHAEDSREPCLDLLGEYGVLINNPLFCFYLDEHTKKIAGHDAVRRFSEAFG